MVRSKRVQGTSWFIAVGVAAFFVQTTLLEASPRFHLMAPSSEWIAREDSGSGAEALLVRKGHSSAMTPLQPSINAIKDPMPQVYADLDGYMSDAFKVLVTEGSHRIRSVKKISRPGGHTYYLVRSNTQGRELLQGVFYQPGKGAFIVTGTAAERDFARHQSDFIAAIESARF